MLNIYGEAVSWKALVVSITECTPAPRFSNYLRPAGDNTIYFYGTIYNCHDAAAWSCGPREQLGLEW